MKILNIVLILLISIQLYACTIGVISGRNTINGKPILFKNRDSSGPFEQEVTTYERTKDTYKYIAITTYKNKKQKYSHPVVGGGINEFGLIIGNATLIPFMPDAFENDNVEINKAVLEKCQDVNCFKDIVNNWKRTVEINSYYGLIDRNDNAVIYYVYTKFHKFYIEEWNVNELPDGFLVKASTGTILNKPKPKARESRITLLIKNELQKNKLSPDYFMNLLKDIGEDIDKLTVAKYVVKSTLNSYRTRSSIIVNNNIMYSNVGEPLTGVYIPATINYVPKILYIDDMTGKDESSKSIANTIFLENKKELYGDLHGNLLDVKKAKELLSNENKLMENLLKIDNTIQKN
jgi:hypothetical protein